MAIVRLGRVAVADEVAECLGARPVLLPIGERPCLSSPDSMGLYATWAPGVGLTDAASNCISSGWPTNLGYEEAADKLHFLRGKIHLRQLSGVQLKEETVGSIGQSQVHQPHSFLLDHAG